MQYISITLKVLNEKYSTKCVTEETSKAGKRYIRELYKWEMLTLFF
jgi:hypothetical protein